jgi:hypothetical protein
MPDLQVIRDDRVTVDQARGLDIDSPRAENPFDEEKRVRGVRFSDAQALRVVVNRWHVADDYRRPYEEKWARWQSEYRLVIRRTRDGSNLPSDEPFTVIETILPRIIQAVFSVDPQFTVQPGNPGAERKAKMVQDLLHFQWSSRMEMVEYLTNFFKSTLKFGTGITKLIWEQDYTEDYHDIEERDPMTGNPTGRVIGSIRKRVQYDSPKAIHIPLYNFWLDPHAKSIEEADWCICEHWTPEYALKELEKEGVYRNVDQLQYYRDTGDYAQADQYRSGSAYGGYGRDYMLKRSGRQSPFDYQDSYSPMVKVWEYYGSYFDEDGRRVPNRLITLADEKVVLRNIANPFHHKRKPFIECRTHVDETEFYGMGFLEVLEPHMIAHQAVNNMIQDNLAFLIQKMFLVGRGARLPVNSVRFRPFGTVHVDDVNQIKQFEVSDTVPSALAQRAWLENKVQNITGATDYIRGGGGGKGETATGVVQGVRQSNLRFDLLLRNFKGFLKRLLLQQHALNTQFMQVPQAIRIKGEEGHYWEHIASKDIGGEVDFAILGDDESADDFGSQQRMLLLFDKLLLDPVLRQTMDVHAVVQRMFQTFKVRGYENLMLDPKRYKDLAFLTLDPAEELYRALRGEPFQVSPGDDHARHIVEHMEQYYAIPQLRQQIAQHIQSHRDAQRTDLQQSNQLMQTGGMPPPLPGAVAGAGGAPASPVGAAQPGSPLSGGSTAGLPIGTGPQALKAM